MVELWSTSGWYTFHAFLSNDGHFLVRMGPWSKGKEASKEHLALAFYQDGKLLNEYSTADLFKDKTAVRRTVSHYTWLAPEWISDVPPDWQSIHDSEAHLRLDHEDVFQLRTLEGTVFRFDCKSGKILERREEPDYRRALGVRSRNSTLPLDSRRDL